MGQEASVSMRCPPHHTHPASITTKLRRFLRKRRRFSKFSPTFFGKSPTFFFFSPTLFEIARTFLSPTALALLPFSLIQLFSFLFARWEGSHARARARAPSSFALFAFTTFTNSIVTIYLTIYYKDIRNTVYLSLWRKGINFHFFEEKSPQRWTTLEDDFPLEKWVLCEGCESKKSKFPGKARTSRAREHLPSSFALLPLHLRFYCLPIIDREPRQPNLQIGISTYQNSTTQS